MLWLLNKVQSFEASFQYAQFKILIAYVTVESYLYIFLSIILWNRASFIANKIQFQWFENWFSYIQGKCMKDSTIVPDCALNDTYKAEEFGFTNNIYNMEALSRSNQ